MTMVATEKLPGVGGIAPPREHLELGDRVTYHHRACVARIPKIKNHWEERHWCLVGPGKESYLGLREASSFFEEGKTFLDNMPVDGRLNKTIVCWPEEGSGFVFGLVRREVGTSVSGYMSGWEIEEWEPGYFAVEERYWLYAIKQSLSGLNVILAPMWAVQKGG